MTNWSDAAFLYQSLSQTLTILPQAISAQREEMKHKDIRAGAMMSKVGNPQVYEDGDQRNSPRTDHNPPKKINEAWERTHFDIEDMDERSIGKTMETAWKQRPYDESRIRSLDPNVDPLGPATVHGNEPSRGAKIDAELKAEDEEMLKKKEEKPGPGETKT